MVLLVPGGREPPLHHGLPEGALAEAGPLGPQPGEPAPRLPPAGARVCQLSRARGERQRRGGQDLRQAPGPPRTLSEHGKSEGHCLEAVVEHDGQPEEEPGGV